MNKDKFIELQYSTLRQEIEDTKNRIFQIIVGGSTLIPIAQYFSQKFEITVLMIALPFLVVTTILLFISENNALMRCGRYIREKIECETTDYCGWETWLEGKKTNYDPRIVDRYLIYSFYTVSSIYFVAAVYLGCYSLFSFGFLALFLGLSIYVLTGIMIGYLIYKHVQFCTSDNLSESESVIQQK